MTVCSRYTTDIKHLIVIRNLAESYREKGEALPPSILSKLKEIGRTFSSTPIGYSWVFKMVEALTPGVAADSDTPASRTTESFEPISVLDSMDHITLLLGNGAFLEAKEIISCLPDLARDGLIEHLTKGTADASIFDSSYDGTYPDLSIARAAALDVKNYKILYTLKEMQYLCEGANGDGIDRLFESLPAHIQTEISQQTKSLLKLKSSFLTKPLAPPTIHVDYAGAFKRGEISADIRGAVVELVRARLEDTYQGQTVLAAPFRACDEGAAGAGSDVTDTITKPRYVSATKKSPEITEVSIPPLTEEYLGLLLKCTDYEFEMKLGLSGGLLLNLFIGAINVEYRQSTDPDADYFILNYSEVFSDMLEDLSNNKSKEAAFLCKLLLREIGIKLEIPSLWILSEMCDEKTVGYLLSHEPPRYIKGKAPEVLDTEFLQASYNEGGPAAVMLVKVLVTTHAMINSILSNKIQFALYTPVEGDSGDTPGNKLIVNIHLSERQNALLNKYLDKIQTHRSDAIKAFMHAAKALDLNSMQKMPRIEKAFTKLSDTTKLPISDDELIAGGADIIDSDYDLLMEIPIDMMCCLAKVIEECEKYFTAKESEICYLILILNRTLDSTFFGDFSVADIEKAIKKFRATHTNEELITLAEKEGSDLKIEFVYLIRYSRLLTTLKVVYSKLDKIQEEFENRLLSPVIRLKALFREGIIKNPVILAELEPPTKPYKLTSKDAFGYKAVLPRLAPPTPVPSATPTLTAAISAHSTAEEISLATISEGPPPIALDTDLLELFNSIKRSSLFTLNPAKKAFSNGLQYALVIHHLLKQVDRSATPEELLLIQKDIDIACYYAVEQLTTAILLEKQHITSPEEAVKFYEAAGHNLLTRCSIAGIVLPNLIKKGIQRLNIITPYTLNPVLIGDMGSAALKSVTSATLKFAGGGMDKSSFSASTDSPLLPVPDIKFKTRIHVIDALKTILWLLHAHCVEPSSKEFSHLLRVKQVMDNLEPIPPSATEKDTAVCTTSSTLKEEGKFTVSLEHEGLNKLERALHRLIDARIDEKMIRLKYYIRSVNNPAKANLARFYIQQAGYLLLEIMEDSLCSAGTQRGIFIDPRPYKHRLDRIANAISLNGLTSEQMEFLQDAYKERNVARYDFDLKATIETSHTLPRSSPSAEKSSTPLSLLALATTSVASRPKRSPLYALTTAAGASTSSAPGGWGKDSESFYEIEEDGEGFTTVLSASDSKLKDKMEKNIAIMLSICEKFAPPFKTHAG